ncbi:hypothetical protein [Azospirillum sp.]|uniref:hypothetical protein n=1 Tax=Azospirillum sp. TaxID=34012 RepID=UPI002D391072|nr:hypothetical protein [Azospirillum sp.]HYD68152.1 hypothetical protein [Azospirillum sp.]
MIHKVLDKLDRKLAEKRLSRELGAWFDKGEAARYCKRLARDHKAHYPALLLYLEGHAPRH